MNPNDMMTRAKAYLYDEFSFIDISNPTTFYRCEYPHVRFELGDGFENGTLERVNQAVERAMCVFKDAFQGAEEVIVLGYAWYGDPLWGGNYEYLLEQLPSRSENHAFTYYDDDNELKVTTSVAWASLKEVNVEKILLGIANNEMGFEPKTTQNVYFFNPKSNSLFYMYDDRGCLVYNVDASKIKPLYERYNDWIVDFHRKEIDEYFAIKEKNEQ